MVRSSSSARDGCFLKRPTRLAARLRHSVERGIKRAFFKTRNARGNLFDPQSDSVTMHTTLRSKGLQHQHVECPLQAIIGMLAHPLPLASYGEA